MRAVLAESYERIHRSQPGRHGHPAARVRAGGERRSLGLTGEEEYSIAGLKSAIAQRRVVVSAKHADGSVRELVATVRIDTPQEREYYSHGGILQYVLRQLLKA